MIVTLSEEELELILVLIDTQNPTNKSTTLWNKINTALKTQKSLNKLLEKKPND